MKPEVFILVLFSFKPLEALRVVPAVVTQLEGAEQGPSPGCTRWLQVGGRGEGAKGKLGRARPYPPIGWILMQHILQGPEIWSAGSLHRCTLLQFLKGRNKFKLGFVKTNDIIPAYSEKLQPQWNIFPFSPLLFMCLTAGLQVFMLHV